MEKEKNQKIIEREYIIPLREKCRPVPRYKKTPKAVKTIKEFLVKHMKIYNRDLNKIKLDKYLNEYLWFRGIRYPPHKIKVKAVKEGDLVRVELVDLPKKLEFKKIRFEKRDKNAKEILEKSKSMMQKAKESLQKPKTEPKIQEKSEKEMGSELSKKELEEKEDKSALVEEGEKFEKKKSKEFKHTEKVQRSPTDKAGEKKNADY